LSKITFIQTGGTIDKDYPRTTKGYAFEFGEPAARRILERLNPSFEYEICTACQKDSLEITEEDRAQLAQMIQDSDSRKFIVTHGTDTLLDTAKYLHEFIWQLDRSAHDKLIVLTGAMRPERFTNSDADINIGAAIAAANVFEEGVYVTMNGVVKHFREMKRDMETGQFY